MRRKNRGEKKCPDNSQPAPTASTIGPCPTITQIVGRPGTGSFLRTIAPPDHPRLPRKSVVRLTDRPDMTLDVYRGRKTTMQQQQQLKGPLNPKQPTNQPIFYIYILIS